MAQVDVTGNVVSAPLAPSAPPQPSIPTINFNAPAPNAPTEQFPTDYVPPDAGRILQPWQVEDRNTYIRAQQQITEQQQQAAQAEWTRIQAMLNVAQNFRSRLTTVLPAIDLYNQISNANPGATPDQINRVIQYAQQSNNPQGNIQGFLHPNEDIGFEQFANMTNAPFAAAQKAVESVPVTPYGTSLGSEINRLPEPLATAGHLATGAVLPVAADIATVGALTPAYMGQAAIQASAIGDQYQAGHLSGEDALRQLGITSAPFLIPFLLRVGTAGAKALAEYAQSDAGAKVLAKLTPERVAETGGPATEVKAEGAGAPAPVSPPSPEFPAPPPIRTLPEGVTPEQAMLATQQQASGGVVRRIGQLATKVDDLLSKFTEDRITPVQNFNRWFSKEADRFTAPVKEAITQWQRNYASADAWATEAGNQLGRRIQNAFGKDPNAVFRDVEGKPILHNGVPLRNADVVENFELLKNRLTPEQYAAAQQAGQFVSAMRDQARASGVRLGSAEGLNGEPVAGYVHRTVTSVDNNGNRLYRAEFGASDRPGVKISEQNSREHLTRSEGAANGVKYANSWAEEYSSHLRALQHRQADLALKAWTDQLSETVAQRVLRTNPEAVANVTQAAGERTAAQQLLRERTARAQRNAVRDARTAVRDAQDEVKRAQRALDRVTTAPELNRPMKEALINRVGAARERLAAANQRMRDAAQGAVERTQRPADVEGVAAAKRLIDQAVQQQREAKAGYRQAMQAAAPSGPQEVLSPGGLPITQGRIFSAENASALRDLRSQTSGRGALGGAVHTLSQPFRYVFSTLDDSFALNQGWNYMLIAPTRWAKTAVETFVTAASPVYREHWLQAHADGVQFILKNAPEAFDANPDFSPRGTIFGRAANIVESAPLGIGKAPGLALRYSDRLFRDFRTQAAVNLAELWKTPGMSAEEEHGLGSAIAKITGVARQGGPESEALFAGRYFRAQTGTLLDAISNGGIQGAKARNLLMRQVLAASTITTLYALKQGKSPAQIAQLLNPNNPQSFTVGGFNLWGPNKPLLAALASLGDSVRLDIQTGSFSPTVSSLRSDIGNRYLRGKANPVLGKLINALSGENAIGQPTGFKHEFLSTNAITPFSIGAARQDVSRGANPLIAYPAEIAGARFSAPTAYQRLTSKLSDLGIDTGQFFTEPGTRADIIKQHPELGALFSGYEDSRRNGSMDQRAKQNLVDTARNQIAQIGDAVRSGQLSPTDIKSKIADINSAARIIRQNEFPNPSNAHQNRLDPLYAMYDDPANQGPDGKPDLTKVAQAQEDYLSQHPDLRAVWEKQQFVPATNDPVEVALKDGQKLVNTYSLKLDGKQVTWFGLKDALWEKVKAGTPGLAKYATYDDYLRHAVGASLGAGADPSQYASIDPASKIISDLATQIHIAMLSANPELGAALRVFYGTDLPNKNLSADAQQRLIEATQALYRQLGINPANGGG